MLRKLFLWYLFFFLVSIGGVFFFIFPHAQAQRLQEVCSDEFATATYNTMASSPKNPINFDNVTQQDFVGLNTNNANSNNVSSMDNVHPFFGGDGDALSGWDADLNGYYSDYPFTKNNFGSGSQIYHRATVNFADLDTQSYSTVADNKPGTELWYLNSAQAEAWHGTGSNPIGLSDFTAKKFNADTAFTLGNTNYQPFSQGGEQVSGGSCPATAFNAMCVNSSSIDEETTATGGPDNHNGRYVDSLPENDSNACYSYCQCGVMYGIVENWALQDTSNGAGEPRLYNYYHQLLFVPTNGGEISNVYLTSAEQTNTDALGNAIQELNTYNIVIPGTAFSTSSQQPINNANGPLWFATGVVKKTIQCNGNDCNFSDKNNTYSPSQLQPGDPNYVAPGNINGAQREQLYPLIGEAGYFCGFGHLGGIAPATDITASITPGKSGSSNDPYNPDMSTQFPAPQGDSAIIGGSLDAYVSRNIGHGVDIQADPTYATASAIADNTQQNGSSMNLPTVCLNPDAIQWGVNTTQNSPSSSGANSYNHGLIKFVVVRGIQDCNNNNVKNIDNGNAFTCKFDNYTTVRACPLGENYDPGVQLGWPCSTQAQRNDPNDPYHQPTTLYQGLSLPTDYKYSTPPFIYVDQMLAGQSSPVAAFNSDPGYKTTNCPTPDSCATAIGIINTDTKTFVGSVMQYVLGFGGGIALLLIIQGGYLLMMSQGDETKVKEARERITSAVIGLLFMIFSAVFLEVIGIDLLNLPGLGR